MPEQKLSPAFALHVEIGAMKSDRFLGEVDELVLGENYFIGTERSEFDYKGKGGQNNLK